MMSGVGVSLQLSVSQFQSLARNHGLTPRDKIKSVGHVAHKSAQDPAASESGICYHREFLGLLFDDHQPSSTPHPTTHPSDQAIIGEYMLSVPH